MKIIIKKWGDSFVVPIPNVFAKNINTGLADVSIDNEKIIIKPVSKIKSISDNLNKEKEHTEPDSRYSEEEYPDITQTRTWELCGSLKIAKPDSCYIVGHNEEGRIITNYAEHIDEVLTENIHE